MNKIIKWVLGLFPALGGILAAILLGSKKTKKVNEIKNKIKDVDKEIKKVKNKSDAFEKSLKSKKKALKQIEKKQFKKKDISAKDVDKFLKKYKK